MRMRRGGSESGLRHGGGADGRAERCQFYAKPAG
jgi:hypothetical protein